MGLPKIQAPLFALTIPSTKQEITYRPFLVKEEKILLIASESKDSKDIMRAIKQIINNCVQEDIDVNKLALFDLEYIFIKIRANSVDNLVEFTVTDKDDGKDYELALDLNEIEVKFPRKEVSNTVELSKDIGVQLRYPTPDLAEKISEDTSPAEITLLTIKNCIETVYDKDNVYPWNENSDAEQDEFIESMPMDAFEKINEFFTYMPKLKHTLKYTNSEGKEKKIVLEGIKDFFSWR